MNSCPKYWNFCPTFEIICSHKVRFQYVTCTKTYSLPHPLTESYKSKHNQSHTLVCCQILGSSMTILESSPKKKDTYQVNFPFSPPEKICFFFNPLKPSFSPPQKKQNPCLLAMVVWTKITETVQIPWSHLKPRSVLKIQNGDGSFVCLKNWLKSSPKMNSKQVHPLKIGWIPKRKGSCIPVASLLKRCEHVRFREGIQQKLPMKTSLSLRFPKTYIQIIQHKSLSCLFSYQQERSTFQFGDCTLESLFRWRPVKLRN